jgi:hypothetical protein
LSDDDEPRRASPLQVAKAVASAFFGVRKRDDHASIKLTPVQVIMAGIIGAALFIGTLVLIVHIVLSRAATLA